MSADPVIAVGQLKVDYGDLPAVKDHLSQVARGEFSALLGTNGSGRAPAPHAIEGNCAVPGMAKLTVVSE